MPYRISNGHGYAVAFTATTEGRFRVALARALSEYLQHGETSGELHVATDSGEWLSPLYPESNAPLRLGRFLSPAHSVRVWRLCQRSRQRGTWFEHELKNLADFVSLPGDRQALRRAQSRGGQTVTAAKRAHLQSIAQLGVLGRRDRAALVEALAQRDLDRAMATAREALVRAWAALHRLPPTPARRADHDAIRAAAAGLGVALVGLA